MSIVYCLSCDRRLVLPPKAKVGDTIVCPTCESEFEIVSLHPPEIDWPYEDDYDYDYDDDEDDDEEE